jgi:hypothetical protein
MSSIATENPPPSRPSTVESGPIPLFDAQLKILTESYLAFFQERSVHLDSSVIALTRIFQEKNRGCIVSITTLDTRTSLDIECKVLNLC